MSKHYWKLGKSRLSQNPSNCRCSWGYGWVASTLPRHCLDLTLTSVLPCLDVTLTFLSPCPGFALTLPWWPFLYLALTLSWSCLDLALTLLWPCIYLAFNLDWLCQPTSKIGSVTAEIFLIWTNLTWTNVAWTNVTLTGGISLMFPGTYL